MTKQLKQIYYNKMYTGRWKEWEGGGFKYTGRGPSCLEKKNFFQYYIYVAWALDYI